MLIKLEQYAKDNNLKTLYQIGRKLGKPSTTIKRWLDKDAMIDTETGHVWTVVSKEPCNIGE